MPNDPHDATPVPVGDDAVLVPDLPDLSGLPGLPDLAGLDAGGDGLDLGNLLGMAMDMQNQMQEQMAAAQDEANHTVVEGQSGGGVVRIEVTGGLVFQKVSIDPDAVDPDDVEMLQDLVLAALHDAVARVNELAEAMNPLSGMDLGGFDLGGLGAMLGLPGTDDDGDGADEDDEADDDEADDDDAAARDADPAT